jgi:hypothetical protein
MRQKKTTAKMRKKKPTTGSLNEAVRELRSALSNFAGEVRRIEVQRGDSRVAVEFAAAPFDVTAADGDLKPGEKVPSVPEQTAVGPFKRRINRGDPEFKTLVSNTNAAIVFKDEEGTGADRMMTTTLKTGLDALAASVAKEWSGVKLRVTEAWDENGEHTPKSLHYEGRAADITTSPVDGAKLGRLARLAVDAGLEWVFFEDSAHVHVSMS